LEDGERCARSVWRTAVDDDREPTDRGRALEHLIDKLARVAAVFD
jgi:hypothetical protein